MPPGSSAPPHLRRSYVWGRYIDELLSMDKTGNSGTERFFFHCNANFSIYAATDRDGEVLERVQYDVFGRPDFQNPSGKSLDREKSIVDNPYLFQGRRLDPESKLFYYRNRYYDPGKGRFVSRDPAGLWESNFAKGNPYSGFDLNSLKFVDFVGLIEYILVGGAWESGNKNDPMVNFKKELIKNRPNVQADDVSYHTWGDFSGIKQSVEEALREERGSVMSRSWNREEGNLKCMGSVKLIGHSWGGSTAYSVAHRIDRSKVGMVQFQLITIDPVSHFLELPKQTSRPNAVDSWHNIHKEPLWSDVVPNIPIIGHVIRGIAAVVETIARGDKGWNEFISTAGGRWGAVSGAFNTKVENLNHMAAWKMYERWQNKTIGSLPNPSK